MARKRKELLSLVGRTEDGKDVVTGVYRLYETEGVPLDVLLDVLKSKDVIPDWEPSSGRLRRPAWAGRGSCPCWTLR